MAYFCSPHSTERVASPVCRRCYEVQCDPTPRLLDGFGDLLDRSHVCLDEAASVIVRVTDSCPW